MTRAQSTSQPRQSDARRSRGRLAIAAVLVVALLATAGLRQWAASQRQTLTQQYVPTARADRQSDLAQIDNYSLGLLLGGLRGPLVMYLWISSEDQKIQRDLEGFRSKVDMIRRLQPEFDSVHLFQIWNKAYNISVMRASTPAKYIEILDALDYAREVLAARPDNINIIESIGEVYEQKLGRSRERTDYLPWVRQQTRSAAGPQGSQTGGRSVHEVMLDANGFILPPLLEPTRPVKAPMDGDGEPTYNGSDLQYLAQYNTPEAGGFPYGLSPLALAYNYNKRGQVLQSQLSQKHLQLSAIVIDSRPNLCLRGWAEEELERARRLEITAVRHGIEAPSDRGELETAIAGIDPATVLPDTSADTAARVKEALFSLRRTQMVCADALHEYDRHLRHFKLNQALYESQHKPIMTVVRLMAQADEVWLTALALSSQLKDLGQVAPGSPQELRKLARQHYREAQVLGYRTVFKYYMDDFLVARVLHPGDSKATTQYARSEIDQLNPAERDFSKLYHDLQVQTAGFMLQAMRSANQPMSPAQAAALKRFDEGKLTWEQVHAFQPWERNQLDGHWDLRQELDRYIERCEQRFQKLQP